MLGFWRIFIICCFAGLQISGYSDENPDEDKIRLCADKFRVLVNHSACIISVSPKIKSSGVSDTDKQLIVDLHNRYRGMVEPFAANMMKMSWDEEVAMVAQLWSSSCSFSHDSNYRRHIPGRFSVGQNIGKGYNNWTSVMEAWYAEYEDFTFGSTKNNFHAVGHYTQVVWATSNKIGCGFADCDGTAFHVCNYAPAGNTPISGIGTPYIKTDIPCNNCSDFCENNLCNCGNKTCENGGVMNLSTCECSCLMDFYVEPECKLDCENITEKSYCGKQSFNEDGCKVYANVPYHCPVICKACPYAAYNYKDVSHVSPSFNTTESAITMVTGIQEIGRGHIQNYNIYLITIVIVFALLLILF